jgi:enoyl-CoA hydratase
MSVRAERSGRVTTVILDRPGARNAVDGPAAAALAAAFRDFDADDGADVAVLWGAGGTFCAGADLKAVGGPDGNRTSPDGDGPMGPTRMHLGKPVIAAISGHAVAGGLELAAWCDLRVAEEDAVLGVFCRRFGVPLIDGGTVRLPALIGLGRALDLILTGRPVPAREALAMGLVDRVVPAGQARAAAEDLARELAALPQACLRSDRAAALEGISLPAGDAMANEFLNGLRVLAEPGFPEGVQRFRAGTGIAHPGQPATCGPGPWTGAGMCLAHGPQRVLCGGGGLPEVAVRVTEVPGVAAPLCALRFLHHGATGRDGLAHDLVHGFARVHDVVERDAAEPGSLRGDTGVLRRRPALVEGQRRRAAAQVQGHEARVVLVDRAAQALGVELLGPGQVLDSEHDGGHLQRHGFLPWMLCFLPLHV